VVESGGSSVVAGLGEIESRTVPGEGTTIFLRGALDVRQASELEEKLEAAHRVHPPVTVDLSETASLDGPIVDILGSASVTFPEGLRVIGSSGNRPSSFELAQVQHLQAT